jgi:ABC-type cobalamin/Fe3+-siderophores transport system ATPase subunit
MERIVIKNFGPIKDVDLEINDFMIFIGPQASGKSTIAKLIYFFKTLNNGLRSFLFDRILNANSNTDIGERKKNYATLWLEEYFIKLFSDTKHYRNSELIFHISNLKIRFKIDNLGKIKVFLPKKFVKDFKEVFEGSKVSFAEDKQDFTTIRATVLFLVESFVIKTFNKNFTQNLYIPAGRGFISTISNQIFNLKTENLDYFIKEFASIIGFIKDNIRFDQSKWEYASEEYKEKYHFIFNLANKLQLNILKGQYFYDEENEKISIEIEKNHFIPLDKASSGQQEAVWVVQYLISRINRLSIRSIFTVIEEPEAHLYPESQKSITELIVLLVNLLNNQAIITTHSPYILASINNLLYANKIGKIHEKEVSKRIDKNLWLDYKSVGAYFVGGEDNEGKVRRIMDDELELIENQYIDSASQIINEDFNFIYALED